MYWLWRTIAAPAVDADLYTYTGGNYTHGLSCSVNNRTYAFTKNQYLMCLIIHVMFNFFVFTSTYYAIVKNIPPVRMFYICLSMPYRTRSPLLYRARRGNIMCVSVVAAYTLHVYYFPYVSSTGLYVQFSRKCGALYGYSTLRTMLIILYRIGAVHTHNRIQPGITGITLMHPPRDRRQHPRTYTLYNVH